MQLTSRILIFLLQIHNRQISTCRNFLYNNGNTKNSVYLRPLLDSIRVHVHRSIYEQKNIVGYNIAALGMMRRIWASNHLSEFESYEKQTAALANSVKSGKKRKVVVKVKEVA